MQADLMGTIKDVLFPAAVTSIFGAAFLQHHSTAQLQKAFFAFEEGFELAASPVPHFFQPSFCHARKTLLEAFRYAMICTGCDLQLCVFLDSMVCQTKLRQHCCSTDVIHLCCFGEAARASVGLEQLL